MLRIVFPQPGLLKEDMSGYEILVYPLFHWIFFLKGTMVNLKSLIKLNYFSFVCCLAILLGGLEDFPYLWNLIAFLGYFLELIILSWFSQVPARSFNVWIQIFFYLWKVFLNCNFDVVVSDRPLTHLLASLVCPPRALSHLSVCFACHHSAVQPSPLSSARTFRHCRRKPCTIPYTSDSPLPPSSWQPLVCFLFV